MLKSYSYRLELLSYIDPVGTYTSWSDWSTSSNVELLYLDEGSYTFYVKGRINKENETDSVSTTFEVNAITGPALRIYPLQQRVTPGNQFDIYLFAEEIEATNALRGIETLLNISNNDIDIIKTAIDNLNLIFLD